MNRVITLIVGLSLVSTSIRAQDPLIVIRKYIELTGGENGWNEVETCEATGLSWYSSGELTNVFGVPKTFVVFRKWPDKQRIDFYKDSTLTESSIYSGGKGTINFRQFSLDLEILVYYDFYPQRLIEKINSKDYSIKFHSVEQMHNQEFIVIEFSGNNLREYYYFNKESNLLEFEKNSLAPDVMTAIDDYRNVGTYLMPFKISKTRNGDLFFTEELSEIKLNTSIPASVFTIK